MTPFCFYEEVPIGCFSPEKHSFMSNRRPALEVSQSPWPSLLFCQKCGSSFFTGRCKLCSETSLLQSRPVPEPMQPTASFSDWLVSRVPGDPYLESMFSLSTSGATWSHPLEHTLCSRLPPTNSAFSFLPKHSSNTVAITFAIWGG